MKAILRFSLLTAATLASVHTLAASPKWDFVELDYVQVDIDDVSSYEPSGFAITGSKLLTENLFLVGSYTTTSDDLQGVDLDSDAFNVELGYKVEMMDSTDWFISAGLINADIEASGFGMSDSDDDTGYSVSTGIRSMLTDSFELAGGIAYVDILDDSETTLGVSGHF